MQENRQKPKNFHLAGIIPLETQPSDFNFPWHDALIPVGPNYLAVERAVYECAFAGCETIWIICSKATTPLIRHRLGDWIYDPTLNYTTLKAVGVWDPKQHYKQIPIFYVPLHPKDKMKRTGIAWSILYGHNRSKHVSRLFSRWMTPSKYYVCFPHGVYSPSQVRQLRANFSSQVSHFLSFDDKTAKDGELLAFTFDSNEFDLMKRAYREEEQLLWRNAIWKNGTVEAEMLPKEERYTGRFVNLQTLLKYIDIKPEQKLPVKWYHDISKWEKYCKFLGSKDSLFMKKSNFYSRYHEFHHIGQDADEDTENDEQIEGIDDEEQIE